MTYSPDTFEIGLQAWVRLALTPFDGTPAGHTVAVIYSDQGGPRPPLPYASVRVLGFREPGDSAIGVVYNSGPDTITNFQRARYEGTVSVQVYGPGHGAMVRAIMASLNQQAARESLDASGLVIAYHLAAPVRLSTDTAGTVEDRTIVDFLFRFSEDTTQDTPDYLDSVIINPTFNT